MYKISVEVVGCTPAHLEAEGLEQVYAIVARYGTPRQYLGQSRGGVYTFALLDDAQCRIGTATAEYVPELLTSGQAAKVLGCSKRHVARLADTGKIPVHSYVGMRGDRRFNADVITGLVGSAELYRRPEAAPRAAS